MNIPAPGITILGLGPGSPDLLTRQAWELLESVDEIYVRTSLHPTVVGFPADLVVHSFDHLYESEVDFRSVYAKIVENVLALGRTPKGVVYAVPGHPFIAESSVLEIVKQARVEHLPIEIVEGLSFLEPVLSALGVDPLPRITVVDALELVNAHHPLSPPDAPVLIAQFYSKLIASEVKLTLMEVYPDEHPVMLVDAAGTPEMVVEEVALYEVDHSDNISLLTSLYVPALGEKTSFESFQELVAHLRSPEGCPWDREQTHQTLRRNLLEETYEALEAIDANNADVMREEFGDLLLQIVLHAQIASEFGEFTMEDVIRGIHTKLIYRHPHVFGEIEVDGSGAVTRNWEQLKAAERNNKGIHDKGLLDGVPLSLPALAQAEAFQRRAARVGFDWESMEGVLEKVIEEVTEVRGAVNTTEYFNEIGDLLFALVNLARWLEIDPESALREANQRFRQRFAYIEKKARQEECNLNEVTLTMMDSWWNEAKKSRGH
jgi:tetrapyrrole methylase family protein/MazG family protein